MNWDLLQSLDHPFNQMYYYLTFMLAQGQSDLTVRGLHNPINLTLTIDINVDMQWIRLLIFTTNFLLHSLKHIPGIYHSTPRYNLPKKEEEEADIVTYTKLSTRINKFTVTA